MNINNFEQPNRAQKPLFLIVSFENLPLIVQRYFIDELEEMYKSKQQEGNCFINLLISYFVGQDIGSKSIILEQFRNQATQVEKDRMVLEDIINFGRIERMMNVSLYMSKFSGFGKTYQIKKKC